MFEALTQKIREAISQDCNGSGISASYYKLSEKVGIKVFDSDNDGIYTCIAQQKLAELGLAPKVYGICVVGRKIAIIMENVIVMDFHCKADLYQKCDDWASPLNKGFGNWRPSDFYKAYNNIGYKLTFNGEPEFYCIDVALFRYIDGNREWCYYNMDDRIHPFHKEYIRYYELLRDNKQERGQVGGYTEMALPTVGLFDTVAA